jgi:hypothetical protein
MKLHWQSLITVKRHVRERELFCGVSKFKLWGAVVKNQNYIYVGVKNRYIIGNLTSFTTNRLSFRILFKCRIIILSFVFSCRETCFSII